MQSLGFWLVFGGEVLLILTIAVILFIDRRKQFKKK